MKLEGKTILVAALLVLSAFLLLNKLLLPTTVQIMVQDGTTTLKEIPNLYTIKDCLLIAASSFLLLNKLLLPTTVQIMVQDGTTTLKEIPNLYTIKDCLLIAASSFLLGVCIVHLLSIKPEPDMRIDHTTAQTFDNAVTHPEVRDLNPEIGPDKIENILNALKGNEQLIIKQLNDSQEINQAELAVRIGIPKFTLSRTLSDMERRKLIVRYDNGMSKMVKLADSLKKNR